MRAYKCDCCGELKEGEAKYSLYAQNDIDTMYDICDDCFKSIECLIKQMRIGREL